MAIIMVIIIIAQHGPSNHTRHRSNPIHRRMALIAADGTWRQAVAVLQPAPIVAQASGSVLAA